MDSVLSILAPNKPPTQIDTAPKNYARLLGLLERGTSVGTKVYDRVAEMVPLPPDILQESVLSFVDLHSLVILSGCSKQCSKIVFADSPVVRWKEVQICDGVKPCNINDDQLKAFLIKINAKENTHSLSLIGCPNITGTGLEPFRQSTVLEDIDLRVVGTSPLKGKQREQYGPTGLNESFVCNVFSSIIEMSPDIRETRILRRIAVRTQPLPLNVSPTVERLYNKRDNFWLSWVSPSYLTDEDNRQSPPLCMASKCTYLWCSPNCSHDTSPRQNRCETCKSYYCRHCTPQLIKCSVCEHTYCKACAIPPTCSECTTPKCQWCSNLTTCDGCNKQCCASHGFECCGKCDRNFCLDCTEEELLFCVVCNQHYCGEECHRGVHG